jgi:hypothetical protein
LLDPFAGISFTSNNDLDEGDCWKTTAAFVRLIASLGSDAAVGTASRRAFSFMTATAAMPPTAWTTCSSSMSAIWRRSWSTAGAHTVRLDNVRPARRCHLHRIDAPKLQRSSQYLSSQASITSISGPHDRRIQFLRRSVLRDADSSRASGRRRKWSPRPSCVGRCGVDRDQRNASSRWNKKTPRVRSVGRS